MPRIPRWHTYEWDPVGISAQHQEPWGMMRGAAPVWGEAPWLSLWETWRSLHGRGEHSHGEEGRLRMFSDTIHICFTRSCTHSTDCAPSGRDLMGAWQLISSACISTRFSLPFSLPQRFFLMSFHLPGAGNGLLTSFLSEWEHLEGWNASFSWRPFYIF